MTATAALARCIVRGCPWRFTSGGPDRVCADHQAGDQASVISRASGFAVEFAMPGDDGHDHEPR